MIDFKWCSTFNASNPHHISHSACKVEYSIWKNKYGEMTKRLILNDVLQSGPYIHLLEKLVNEVSSNIKGKKIIKRRNLSIASFS